jgi:hypothetical protein
MPLRLFAFSKAGGIKNPNFAYLCIAGALQKLPVAITDTHRWVLL